MIQNHPDISAMLPIRDPMIMQIAYERYMDHGKWANEIPELIFRDTWKVRITPPSSFAVVRFRVKGLKGKEVSIYLDCYNDLGYMGEPYWEMYPNNEGDTSRFLMNDVSGLLKEISLTID